MTPYFSAPTFALSGTTSVAQVSSIVTATSAPLTDIHDARIQKISVSRENLATLMTYDPVLASLFNESVITSASAATNPMLSKIWSYYAPLNTNLASIAVPADAKAGWTKFVTDLNLPAFVTNAAALVTSLPVLKKDDVLYLPIALKVGGSDPVYFYYQLTLSN